MPRWLVPGCSDSVTFLLFVRWTSWSVALSASRACLRAARYQIRSSVSAVTNASWPPEKHELWECPGNSLITHVNMKTSEHLVPLDKELWDTVQVLFSRSLTPLSTGCQNVSTKKVRRSGCGKAKFSADGIRFRRWQRPAHILEASCLWYRHFFVQTDETPISSCNESVSCEGKCLADKQSQEPSVGELSRSRVVSTVSQTSNSPFTQYA